MSCAKVYSKLWFNLCFNEILDERAVVSAVISHQGFGEGPFLRGVFVLSLCPHGFPRGPPVSSYIPKACMLY